MVYIRNVVFLKEQLVYDCGMNTSWEEVANWYDKAVGKGGHYFHENIILPNLLGELAFEKTKEPRLLDLGCGNGILGMHIPKNVFYAGVDLSKSLIEKAKLNRKGIYKVHDLTKPMSLNEKDFTHITLILSLQNMENPAAVLENARQHLAKGGSIFIVLNHPCFRIPRQTSWGVDQEKKIQYRRIDRYLTPLEIPIAMHPGESDTKTFSYHHPISTYVNLLGNLGLGVVKMQEWTSDKLSLGKLAKMENRAREEFPLFCLLIAKNFAS